MKRLFLITLLFFVAACGASAPGGSAPNELHADILMRSATEKPVLEITFYSVNEGETNKGSAKNVIAVNDAQFNGTAMTPAANLSGQTIYKIDGVAIKAQNVVTASTGGRVYSGSTMLETQKANKMTSLVLNPAAVGGTP